MAPYQFAVDVFNNLAHPKIARPGGNLGVQHNLQEQIAQLFPTGAAMKLFIDSYSDASVFDDSVVSYAVILVWGVVAYALLVWQLSRRRA